MPLPSGSRASSTATSGPQRRDPPGRLLRRAGLADHLDVALGLQQVDQAAPDHFVVVEQEDTDHSSFIPGPARHQGTKVPTAPRCSTGCPIHDGYTDSRLHGRTPGTGRPVIAHRTARGRRRGRGCARLPSLRSTCQRAGVDSAVPDDIVPEVLAVLREALSNVARHARAGPSGCRCGSADGQVICGSRTTAWASTRNGPRRGGEHGGTRTRPGRHLRRRPGSGRRHGADLAGAVRRIPGETGLSALNRRMPAWHRNETRHGRGPGVRGRVRTGDITTTVAVLAARSSCGRYCHDHVRRVRPAARRGGGDPRAVAAQQPALAVPPARRRHRDAGRRARSSRRRPRGLGGADRLRRGRLQRPPRPGGRRHTRART